MSIVRQLFEASAVLGERISLGIEVRLDPPDGIGRQMVRHHRLDATDRQLASRRARDAELRRAERRSSVGSIGFGSEWPGFGRFRLTQSS